MLYSETDLREKSSCTHHSTHKKYSCCMMVVVFVRGTPQRTRNPKTRFPRRKTSFRSGNMFPLRKLVFRGGNAFSAAEN